MLGVNIINKIYFPSSKAWKNSVILLAFTYASGLIIPITFVWYLIALSCYYGLTLNPLVLVAILGTSLCCLMLCFLFCIASIPYFIVLELCKFIFGYSVKLLDPPLDLDKNIEYWLTIIAFSSLPFFLIQFINAIGSVSSIELLFNTYYIFKETDMDSIATSLSPIKFLQFSWIWLIIAAYLYEFKHPQKNKS